MDFTSLIETFISLLKAVPLTLQLACFSLCLGACLALILALMRLSKILVFSLFSRLYVLVFRGTPLLVQIFLIYNGLGQFPAIRQSFLWPFLREPYWCALLSLTLCTAAYGCEIIRGGLLSVSHNQIEAAKAYGMSRTTAFRRIKLPLAIRQALPAYGNEVITMVKSTSLASTITLFEITGVAAKIISETYHWFEVLLMAGALYLTINFTLTRLIKWLEYRLSPHLRDSVHFPCSDTQQETSAATP